MGQIQQVPNKIKPRVHTRCSTIAAEHSRACVKTVIVKFRGIVKNLLIEDYSMTCGWLLSEVIRLFPDVNNIIGLRCVNRIDVIDMWLQEFERPIGIIKDLTVLTPILSQSIPECLELNWFQPISVIGKGGFSEVMLVRKRDDGQLYALKVMKKNHIIKEGKVKNVLDECNLLKKLRHPFIITLRWAFQSAKELFLVTDFCPGGELFFHLHNLGRFTEDQARFYFCEILLAIEHLHNQKIIFRDLKPENTLIDLDGHIKLVDFGLATKDTGIKQNAFCGSHEYLSPEMIRGSGYNKCVDFYSLGSFLYEMITGLPPFWDENREQLYENILNKDLVIPKYMSQNLASLLGGLLRKDPTLRIGSILGVREIKQHPWLNGVNWENFKQLKVQAPFRPNSTRSNFDSEIPINDENSKLFSDYSYFDSKKDSNFSEFFYTNPEKARNHELVFSLETSEEITSSRSFIEIKIPSPAKTSAFRNHLHESASKSPLCQRIKKMSPEVTSGKVPAKIIKSNNPKALKTKAHSLSKSFINTRFSLSHLRAEMN